MAHDDSHLGELESTLKAHATQLVESLEKGRFVWPATAGAAAALTPAQLAMLLEGIDWRTPLRTDRPTITG